MKPSWLLCVPTAVLTVSMAVAQSPVVAPAPAPAQAKRAPAVSKRAPVVASAPRPAPAAAAAAIAAPSPEDVDDPWEERKLRAREDVEYLEALQKAKQAECREAEVRNQKVVAFRTDINRQKQKGYASTYQINQSEVSIAESQSQLEMRRAELKDVEVRLARARRWLRTIERSPSALESDAPRSDDRLRDLELKYDRLRRELEFSRRVRTLDRMDIEQRAPVPR